MVVLNVGLAIYLLEEKMDMALCMDNRPFKRVYEPGNPDANAEGYVMYPDINVVEEMANLMTAQRNYEANVTTVDAVKGMYIKALDIGR